jgi:AmpD protein
VIKWLLLFIGAGFFYLWLKGKKQAEFTAKENLKTGAQAKQKLHEPEIMVQCQHCKVHLPQSEAIIEEHRFYCSEQHLQSLDARGWLGCAAWRNSPNCDPRPDGCIPNLVVVHHISLPPGGFKERNCTQFIVDFFQNKLNTSLHPYFQEIAEQKVSSHFLISRSGSMIQFVSTLDRAWHAGVSNFFGREKCNDFSIGIELEGDGEVPFEEVQYQALAKLVADLQQTYPQLHFAGHSDIAPERKTDPGSYFDWKKFQAEAGISEEKFPYGLHSR